jgi:membrane protein YqaA with SNARE-associated domain
MLRRLYDWTLSLAAHRHARWALAGVSFAESSVFPIPPDVVLIPMVLSERAMAWIDAAICTVASVLGGFAGYAIGYFLFETVGAAILDFYGLTDAFAAFAARYNEYGAWIVFTAGVTPIPFKLITIASGATGLNLAVFAIASIAARGIRFFAVAGLLYWLGPPIRAFVEERLALVFTVFVVLLIGGFVMLKYLV